MCVLKFVVFFFFFFLNLHYRFIYSRHKRNCNNNNWAREGEKQLKKNSTFSWRGVFWINFGVQFDILSWQIIVVHLVSGYFTVFVGKKKTRLIAVYHKFIAMKTTSIKGCEQRRCAHLFTLVLFCLQRLAPEFLREKKINNKKKCT